MGTERIPIREAAPSYALLPFRFRRIPGLDGVLMTAESGEHAFVDPNTLVDIVDKRLSTKTAFYKDLVAKHFLYEPEGHSPLPEIAAQVRSRKAFLREGPALHIIVVTLRCDHSCQYCQVSRQGPDLTAFDLPREHIPHIVNRLMESPAQAITVEFQGGEPLLAFSIIEALVLAIEQAKLEHNKTVSYVIASTLHHLNDDILAFCLQYSIHLSTSIDGPAFLHNANRPLPTRDSYERTVAGIFRAREYLGAEAVAALTTITEKSLNYPREIVDEYVRLGFDAIFLRPLSLYGFAQKSHGRIGYSKARFMQFYVEALEYLISLNKQGVRIEESYISLLLTHILTPFSTGYVDLRSPAGAGIGVLVYNYDGKVYPSDEARMLVEMGDDSLCLGRVDEPLSTLLRSEPMQALLNAGINEAIPGCTDCAYRTYCGADPVDNYARYRDPMAHRIGNAFCERHLQLFDWLFTKLYRQEQDTMRVFMSWLRKKSFEEIGVPVAESPTC